MSIESIKRYVYLWLISDSTVEERLKIITEQKEIALKQLEEAKKRVEFLKKKQYLLQHIKW
jgi:DNA-binding transcriptional MerR regulator